MTRDGHRQGHPSGCHWCALAMTPEGISHLLPKARRCLESLAYLLTPGMWSCSSAETEKPAANCSSDSRPKFWAGASVSWCIHSSGISVWVWVYRSGICCGFQAAGTATLLLLRLMRAVSKTRVFIRKCICHVEHHRRRNNAAVAAITVPQSGSKESREPASTHRVSHILIILHAKPGMIILEALYLTFHRNYDGVP